MKARALLALGLALAAGPLAAGETTFVLDPVHSSLNFRIRHLYADFVRSFDRFSGTMTVDTNDLSTLKVKAEVDVASIYTGNADRDKHLRTADFFDVARFPTATFESRKVIPGPDHALTINGLLTLRGVTAELTFAGKLTGYGVGPKGEKRVGFHGEATFDRTAFGITYNMKLPSGITVLGDRVDLLLDAEAVESTPAPAADRTLAEQLQARKAADEQALPAEVKAALADAQAKIAAQQGVDGLKVGDKAPDFTLPDAHGKPVTLSAALKQGPVVLVFYRGEWCPFCNLQLHAIEVALPRMKALGASVLAISPQQIDKSVVQENEGSLTFPLLSDTKGDTLRAYKLLYAIPPEMKALFKERFKLDLETYNGPGRWELPVTATYIVAQDGTITAGMVDKDYTRRMEPAAMVAALTALKAK